MISIRTDAATLQITRSPSGGGVDVQLTGTNGQSWRLLSSTNLTNWSAMMTNQVGTDGKALFHVSSPPPMRFYRAQMISSGSGGTTGNTIVALSPAYSDVTNAIARANAGDTVLIPAGSAIWQSRTLTLNKSITLRGAGTVPPSQTRIQNGASDGTGAVAALINISMPSDLPVRVTGIYFDNVFNPNLSGNGYQTPNKGDIRVTGRNYNGNGVALTQVRIDHCAFYKGKMPVMWSGWAYGLTDHNTFTNADIGVGVWADDNFAWQREIKPGTSNAVFIEDNQFYFDNSADYNLNEQVYHQEGARSVIRYNNFDGSRYTLGDGFFIDSHGNWAGAPNTGYYGANNAVDARGQPLIEMYNNTFHAHQTYQFVNDRGGSMLVHDNLFIHDSRPAQVVTLTEEEGWQSILFSPLRTVWPAEDQVNATFFWNNQCRFNGATTPRAMASTDVSTSWNANDSIFIKENRDFWMKAPDATTCTVYPQVVNFPSTIIYPMRYTCITSYTPYPYPHPMAAQP
jgi:hypothetical protein